ncbi:MAG: PaaI family thioesterase [Clostridium sp.]|nr:PaaI family thioesterase [Clostridium sp.]
MEMKEERRGTYADAWVNKAPGAPEQEDFRKWIGLKIIEARPGYAKGEIELKPWHMNVLGIVHGGVLFTIADTVSGTAAVTGHEYSVPTVNGTINYMRAGKDTKKIIAEAHEIKNGKNFSVCECKICDDKENVLAVTTMTFLHLMPPAK